MNSITCKNICNLPKTFQLTKNGLRRTENYFSLVENVFSGPKMNSMTCKIFSIGPQHF